MCPINAWGLELQPVCVCTCLSRGNLQYASLGNSFMVEVACCYVYM